MTTQRRVLVIAGLVFSAIALTFGGLQALRDRRERAAAIAEADSLRISNLTLKQVVAASDARAEQWKGIAERADSVSRAKDQRVVQLQLRNRQLDSVLRGMPNATASDSLQVYKQKVDNLTDQVVELAGSRDSARSSYQSERQRARELAAGKDSVTAMLTAVEANNFRLRNDLAASRAPCRIWLFNCPSRTRVAMLGVGIGAGVTYLLLARRP